MNKLRRSRLSHREARERSSRIPLIESPNQKRGQKYFRDERPLGVSLGESRARARFRIMRISLTTRAGRSLVLFEKSSLLPATSIAQETKYAAVTSLGALKCRQKVETNVRRDCRARNPKNGRSPRWDFRFLGRKQCSVSRSVPIKNIRAFQRDGVAAAVIACKRLRGRVKYL